MIIYEAGYNLTTGEKLYTITYGPKEPFWPTDKVMESDKSAKETYHQFTADTTMDTSMVDSKVQSWLLSKGKWHANSFYSITGGVFEGFYIIIDPIRRDLDLSGLVNEDLTKVSENLLVKVTPDLVPTRVGYMMDNSPKNVSAMNTVLTQNQQDNLTKVLDKGAFLLLFQPIKENGDCLIDTFVRSDLEVDKDGKFNW